MRLLIAALVILVVTASLASSARQNQAAVEKGQRLEDLAWPEAERLLTKDAVVVLPLGAASKEHGPHLKLRNDLTMAEYLTGRVLDAAAVVAAPTLTYHHYPAFLEYPGSTSLSVETARDLTVDVIRTLAAYGPRRFYVLNTGISTRQPLSLAAGVLASEGILVRHTNLNAKLDSAIKSIARQEGGTHADEIETSMMLYIDPAVVDMTKAVKDYTPSASALRLTRQRGGQGTYSSTGIWGDPTLATREKGRVFVETLVSGILDDIASLRTAALPTATAAPTSAAPRGGGPPSAFPTEGLANPMCTAGDQRTIRAIGDAFSTAWMEKDSRRLGGLWATGGNIIHPDGVVEHTAAMIEANRGRLFATREYRSSRHPVTITMVTCLSADVAVADGKWELRGVLDRTGNAVPPMSGLVTLVVKNPGDWKIVAYRYTVTPPPQGSTPPSSQTRPGVIIR
jgi:creatinine amidohydrolase